MSCECCYEISIGQDEHEARRGTYPEQITGVQAFCLVILCTSPHLVSKTGKYANFTKLFKAVQLKIICYCIALQVLTSGSVHILTNNQQIMHLYPI